MKIKDERAIVKFLNKMARLNEDVPFKYNKEGIVIADVSNFEDSDKITLQSLDLPKKYYASPADHSDNMRTATILDSKTRRRITCLLIDECSKKGNTNNYDGYKDFEPSEFTLGSLFRKAGNRIKNGAKYIFSKRKSAEVNIETKPVEPKKTESKKPQYSAEQKWLDEKVKKPIVKQVPKRETPIKPIIPDRKSDYTEYYKLANMIRESEVNKREVIIPETQLDLTEYNKLVNMARELGVNDIPVKEEVKVPAKSVEPVPTEIKTDKKREAIDKLYDLNCKQAYAKLDEFEKMFVDDAKAECLQPGDNEFNQMLNERCVNKDRIMKYYESINNNKNEYDKNLIKLDSKNNQDDLLFLFVNLDDFERMFVEDAIAENISVDDNEFRQMLSERTVNKEHVKHFMNAYKNYIVKQKELISKYSGLTTDKDLSVLTINDLRQKVKFYKDKLTDEELKQYKSSKLKKSELIDILDRVDKNNINSIKKGVCR